jgi:polyisoprenoid-binding protein YceI
MSRLLPVTFVLLLSAGAAQAGQTYSFEPGQALVSIETGPRTARLAAVNRSLAGRVTEQEGGALKAELKLAIAPFTTGNGPRDSRLLATLAVAAFPEATFTGIAAPAQDGKTRFEGTLAFRGISRPIVVPVTLVRLDGRLYGHASFVVHLRDFGVPVQEGVSDEATVEIDAGLRADRTGLVASRG